MKSMGKLYGIGVGPGDPELLTVKAVNILNKVDIVYSACSTKNNHSLAFEIASKYIPKDTPKVFLPFPMVMDKNEARRYWISHAKKILKEIYEGKEVGFLTLGDPLTYSTFGYLLNSIHEIDPNTEVVVVPGITSYQAAAALTNTVLVEGEDTLSIVSGVKGGDHLRKLTHLSENIVFLKAYKNIEDIYLALKETDRLGSSIAVVRCGFEDQEVIRDMNKLRDKKPKYWTLIISKK